MRNFSAKNSFRPHSGLPGRQTTGSSKILRPGETCHSIANASRAAVLVDGDAYFRRLRQVLAGATSSILIIGWDFDGSIRLPGGEEDGLGTTLAAILRYLVEARPEFQIRILVWNLSTIHAPGATMPLLFGEQWMDHPRIEVKLDAQHPLYGAQHQKIVCVDGVVAFAGGIDLTTDRWDTPAHDPKQTERDTPHQVPHGPIHDLHMIFDGEAAGRLCGLAGEQWLRATGEEILADSSEADLWPPDLVPDFKDVAVGIARTAPRWNGSPAVREVEALNHAAIRAAKDCIYAEAQYLADERIGKALASRLEEPEGPEIVIVVTEETHGVVEGWIMGGNRDRLIRRLRKADRHGRLRILHPVVEGEDGPHGILIHSKLLVIDDSLLRIGSSNLNRRSTGLDLECDVAIEAFDHATAEAIVRIRNLLLAEHLGTEPSRFGEEVEAQGSVVRAIDRLNGGPRRLEEFANVRKVGPTGLRPGTRFLDPRQPIALLSRLPLQHRKRQR